MNDNIKRESILAAANNLRWEVGENLHDALMESIYENATTIASKVVIYPDKKPAFSLDRTLDKILTSKYLGFPIMLLILAVVFWITIQGANIPSGLIASLLVDTLHPALKNIANSIGFPWWLSGVLIDGAYLSMAWVVSVMLPPMAIFFPI